MRNAFENISSELKAGKGKQRQRMDLCDPKAEVAAVNGARGETASGMHRRIRSEKKAIC